VAGGEFPLTFSQDQFRAAAGGHPDAVTSLHVSYRIRGKLEVAAFIAALGDVVTRHEALRVAMRESPQGEPTQSLLPDPQPDALVRRQLVRGRSEAQFDRYASGVLTRDLFTSWDLGTQYPFRFHLLRFAPELHAFLASFPHALFDGRSRGIFIRDLWSCYQVRHAGHRPAPVATSFLESARDERNRYGTRAATVNRDFWHRRIVNSPPTCQFMPSTGSSAADARDCEREWVFRSGELDRLRDLCQEHGCTVPQWIISAFATTVLAFTPQDRIVVFVPVDLRRAADGDVIGMFASDLPLTVDRDRARSGILAQVKRELLTTLTRAQVAGDSVQRAYGHLRQVWGATAFDCLSVRFTQHEAEREGNTVPDLVLDLDAYSRTVPYAVRHVDLQVDISEASIAVSLWAGADVLPASIASDFIATLSSALTGGEVGQAGPTAKIAERAGLAPMFNEDGLAVMWVSPSAVEKLLMSHPLVQAAEVNARHSPGRMSRLTADVVTTRPVTPESLTDYCRASIDAAAFRLAPTEVTVRLADSLAGQHPHRAVVPSEQD
jgi:hypothetical protein